jgi:methyl-accepting chemotaxis protein
VEESAAAADSLRQQARQLVDAVAVFRLAGGPGGSDPYGPAALSPNDAAFRPTRPPTSVGRARQAQAWASD